MAYPSMFWPPLSGSSQVITTVASFKTDLGSAGATGACAANT